MSHFFLVAENFSQNHLAEKINTPISVIFTDRLNTMEPKREQPNIDKLLHDNIIIPKAMIWNFFARQLTEQIQPQLSLKTPPLFKVCPNFHLQLILLI